jgi:hypothetical protein
MFFIYSSLLVIVVVCLHSKNYVPLHNVTFKAQNFLGVKQFSIFVVCLLEFTMFTNKLRIIGYCC